jgi:glycosyltransferase involved in cell wall biosynthesis
MIGGAEIAVAELSNALHRLGAEVTIIAPEYQESNVNTGLAFNVPVIRYRCTQMIPDFIPMTYAMMKIARSADAIHAHFLYPSGLAGVIIKYLLHRPCVVTMHGMDIQVYKSLGYGLRLDWRLDLIVKFVLRKVNALIAPSKFIAEEAMKAGADPSKVHILPNGVDTSKFNPSISGEAMRRELGIDREEHVVLTVANFRTVKGYTYLVHAIPLILKEYPKTKFIFCGKGPDEQNTINMVRTLGLSKNVIFAGSVNQNKMPMLYATSDVFIDPSLGEWAGIAVLEALSSAKPVVLARTKKDYLLDLVGGEMSSVIFVNPQNPTQLAEAIINCLEDPSLTRIARVLSEKIVQNLSWKAVADRTLTLYKSLP